MLVTYEKWSMDFRIADTSTPKAAQPKPVANPMSGTVSIPQAGSRPNAMATSSGAVPYTPARAATHRTSPVTSSSVSTGAARMAS